MARQINIELIDDIDGTVLGEDGTTIRFSVGGADYEIDLNSSNAEAFHEALAPYIKNGRKVASNSRRGASRSRTASNTDTKAVREWARDNGYEVSDRGRIPAPILEAFAAAH